MTLYVDNARISVRVRNRMYLLSHLTAASQDELHEFAERFGFYWSSSTLVLYVTATQRTKVVLMGATEIDRCQMDALIAAHRQTMRTEEKR